MNGHVHNHTTSENGELHMIGIPDIQAVHINITISTERQQVQKSNKVAIKRAWQLTLGEIQ